MNYTNTLNHTNTFCGAYCELLSNNVTFLFIHFYAGLFVAMHLMAKCCKCIGLLDQHIQETIMDNVLSDETSSEDESYEQSYEQSITVEKITEEYTNEIVSDEDNEPIDMMVRYEKLYNIVDLIIENYVPIKKYREKIPTDFMSEHDIDVYGTIYEWGSFCQSLNRFELDYFLENLVAYVGSMDGRFKRYLKKYRNEIESDYHHFLLNIGNLNRTTLFTPDYDE
jgi:hypothetical protein